MRVRIPDAAAGRRVRRAPDRGGPAVRLGVRLLTGAVEAGAAGARSGSVGRSYAHRRGRPRVGRDTPRTSATSPGSSARQELRRGRIDHALFMLVRVQLGPKVYPAGGAGARVRRRGRRARAGHALPARHVRRPRSTRSRGSRAGRRRSSAPWPATGMYLGDTRRHGWDIEIESGATYTSFGWPDPIVAFARRPASGARPTAATTSTGRRGRLAPPPARGRPLRGRAELLRPRESG